MDPEPLSSCVVKKRKLYNLSLSDCRVSLPC